MPSNASRLIAIGEADLVWNVEPRHAIFERLWAIVMDAAAYRNANLEKGIVQLIYCSRLSQRSCQPAYNRVVENIVASSTDRNLLRKITGTLLTDRRFLAQIIEGLPPEVYRLYRSIVRDERHHGITLLQSTVTNIRLFPLWPMALVEVDDMSYVGRLSVQSAPEDLRDACLSILKSLRPVFCSR